MPELGVGAAFMLPWTGVRHSHRVDTRRHEGGPTDRFMPFCSPGPTNFQLVGSVVWLAVRRSRGR